MTIRHAWSEPDLFEWGTRTACIFMYPRGIRYFNAPLNHGGVSTLWEAMRDER